MKQQWIFAITALATILALFFTAGCTESARPPSSDRTFLSVDFQPGQTLRYRFKSDRKVILDWNPGEAKKKSASTTSESVEMVMAYTTLEADDSGLTKVKATCESLRAKGDKRNAVASLAGKSFVMTVGPNGKVHEREDFTKIIRQAGDKAFRTGSKDSRIKEADLIDDFVSIQWSPWDSAASIEKPYEGLTVGQQWTSTLPIPNSMILRRSRGVTYQLKELLDTDAGQMAVIAGEFGPADKAKIDWPMPYTGSFRMAGTFGFMRSMFGGLRTESITGESEQLYNIDAGRIESDTQSYKVVLQSKGSPLPGANPQITIDQTLTTELLKD